MKLSRNKIAIIWAGTTLLIFPICNVFYRYQDLRNAKAEVVSCAKQLKVSKDFSKAASKSSLEVMTMGIEGWFKAEGDLNEAKDQYEKYLRKSVWAIIFLACYVSLFAFFLIF